MSDNELFKSLDKKASVVLSEEMHEINPLCKCHNCGWQVTATADICENCGDWLLKGKCNFCYSSVEEGQLFCSECGNPPSGIICKSCGTLSHFDFCPKCETAQTEQAEVMIQELSNSQEFQNIITLSIADLQSTSKHINADSSKLNDYLLKLNQPKIQRKSFLLNTENSNDSHIKAAEQSAVKVKNEQNEKSLQQQKEKAAIELLKEIQRKTFSNNQEARRFFGALKIILPKVITRHNKIGWVCNAFNCTHDAPQDCADPSQGGTWLYETSTEISSQEIAI